MSWFWGKNTAVEEYSEEESSDEEGSYEEASLEGHSQHEDEETHERELDDASEESSDREAAAELILGENGREELATEPPEEPDASEGEPKVGSPKDLKKSSWFGWGRRSKSRDDEEEDEQDAEISFHEEEGEEEEEEEKKDFEEVADLVNEEEEDEQHSVSADDETTVESGGEGGEEGAYDADGGGSLTVGNDDSSSRVEEEFPPHSRDSDAESDSALQNSLQLKQEVSAFLMQQDDGDDGHDGESDASEDEDLPHTVEVDGNPPSRERTMSGISMTGADDIEEMEEEIPAAEEMEATTAAVSSDEAAAAQESEQEEEEVTSTAEKQSLLVLAAEHDRVDILQAILSESTEEDREKLLTGDNGAASIPPLHVAVSYGSVNAATCLLRLGADPSIRPDVKAIRALAASEEAPVDVPHMHRFDGVSAWEIAFGDGNAPTGKNRWSLFGGSSSNLDESTRSTTSARSRRSIQPADIPPSKREGIRHAFTAEALRCIGSDEVERLRQLLAAGMPESCDIGGKNLTEWCHEMGSEQCEELLRGDEGDATAAAPRKSAVLDRPDADQESVPSLRNRLDELESLSRALGQCLDNLAEEVSVCSGLLLVGSGASALATHVRSLKASKERKLEEMERLEESWENSEDELAYWVRECGPEGERIAAQLSVPVEAKAPPEELSGDVPEQRQQLKIQIAASENKVRQLRASIADLSEENVRNLAEVERRGLSGGINLVRGLREEIRDIEFQLAEVKSGEAACRTKISLIQAKIKQKKSHGTENGGGTPHSNGHDDQPPVNGGAPSDTQATDESALCGNDGGDIEEVSGAESSIHVEAKYVGELSDWERIQTGESTALVVRPRDGNRGFFTFNLLRIILRIMGLGDDTRSTTASRSSSQHDGSSARAPMLV
jgi:hypothetical protein